VGYRGKVVEQERARELRAQGWTYTEIMAELGVSKSSVSLWCRDVPVDEAVWSARARANRNEGARNRAPNRLQVAKQAEIEACRRQAAALIGELSDRDLLIAGAALYAGEGSKTDGYGVRFANSDPRMISLFMAWFRRFCEVDESRLRMRLYLHQGLDLDGANRHWSKVTGIPVAQFIRAYRAIPDPSIRRTKHQYGCATVIYSSAAAHRLLMGMVEAVLWPTSFRGSSAGRAFDC
jgi:transcriptional regulator with XRE-family HTH domain